MAKATAQKGRAAHLPEQPGQAFGARCATGGQEGSELFRQVLKDGSGFEHPHRRFSTMVHQRRDLRVGIGGNKSTAELVAIIDADQPRVVLGTVVTQG